MISDTIGHLWHTTWFAAVAALLALALRNHRATVRYWIWFAASCKFLVPFSLLMGLGSRLAPVLEDQRVAVDVAAAAIPMLETLWLPAGVAPIPVTRDWTVLIVLTIWILGSLAIAVIRGREWLRIRSAIRSSQFLKSRDGVELRSSPGLLEPGVVGIFNPVLLLPAGIRQILSDEQLEAVVAHELCHVRRRDNLFAAIHMFVESIFWFHPLAWWLGARLLQEREKACDEDVLRAGGDPHVYATAILNVCKVYIESPLSCVAGVTGGSNVRRRIEAILAAVPMQNLSRPKAAALTVAALSIIAFPIAVGVAYTPKILAQSATVPKFEVASIKPCKDEPGMRRGGTTSVTPGLLNTGCLALADENHLGLIQRAYVRFAGGRPSGFQIVPIKGGPSWVRTELFEVIAKADGNVSPAMMQGPMLQALLEDRFKLRIRRETTEVPVFVLTANNKTRLKPATAGGCVPPANFPVPALPPGQRYCKVRIGMQPPAVDAEGSNIAEFAKLLAVLLQRPVIDKTELTGAFDIHLEFAPDAATPGLLKADDSSAGASIFTAIQEQLGLKLERGRGPGEFLVIDSVQRPSPN
jgi:bla regulator protein blaR1